MGFIRKVVKKKKGKEYTYLYYCERRRSRKKDGGNGKVISIEKNLGYSILGMEYLGFWLWDGLSLKDFFKAYYRYDLDYWIKQGLRVYIEWKATKGKITGAKIFFRGSANLDVRKRHFKDLKRSLQYDLSQFIECTQSIDHAIEGIAYWLIKYENAKKEQLNCEKKSQDYEKQKDYDFAGRYAGHAEFYRDHQSVAWEKYQKNRKQIKRRAPPSEQERFMTQVDRKCESLAADPVATINRYEIRYYGCTLSIL